MGELDKPREKYEIRKGGITPTWIVVHHSLTKDGTAKDWDAIKKYHTSFRFQGKIITGKEYEEYKSRGQTSGLERPWKDIGYHFGIEEVEGRFMVQKGRPVGTIGAHCHGFNDCSIGVCVVGNYDSAPPDEERLRLLVSLLRDFQRIFKIAGDHVVGHRETFTARGVPVEKSCPGSAWDMDAFRQTLL